MKRPLGSAAQLFGRVTFFCTLVIGLLNVPAMGAAATSATSRVLPQAMFSSCAAANAAGYYNIPIGHPAYSSRLDGDKDGIACEWKGVGSPPPLPNPSPSPQPSPSPSPSPSPKPTPTPTPTRAGQIYGVDAQGNLQYFQGTIAGGMKYVGKRGSGWQGMTALAQIDNIAGDTNRDLLARRGTDHSLWLYRGLPNGWVETVGQVGQNWGGMDQIVPVFNLGGGDAQYVVARRAADGVLFRYTITAKGLTGIKQIGTGWGSMRQIIGVGDFTGDKRADVLAIRTDGTLWIYQGTAQATIGAGKQVGRGWNGFIRAVSPGDLTGDSKYDLVGQRQDGVVFGYRNLGGSWDAARQILSGTATYRLLA